ncbi:MAG: hypothetical protein JWQ21_2139 [Herminiimonas sp.]|nr:hypothetical protein [Herminiimonas sp.]
MCGRAKECDCAADMSQLYGMDLDLVKIFVADLALFTPGYGTVRRCIERSRAGFTRDYTKRQVKSALRLRHQPNVKSY